MNQHHTYSTRSTVRARGQNLVEFGLVVGLVAVVGVATCAQLGLSLRDGLSNTVLSFGGTPTGVTAPGGTGGNLPSLLGTSSPGGITSGLANGSGLPTGGMQAISGAGTTSQNGQTATLDLPPSSGESAGNSGGGATQGGTFTMPTVTAVMAPGGTTAGMENTAQPPMVMAPPAGVPTSQAPILPPLNSPTPSNPVPDGSGGWIPNDTSASMAVETSGVSGGMIRGAGSLSGSGGAGSAVTSSQTGNFGSLTIGRGTGFQMDMQAVPHLMIQQEQLNTMQQQMMGF